MGIGGLYKALKPLMTPIHFKDLAGQSAAVDVSVWMHRTKTSVFKYVTKRVDKLRSFGIEVVLVFDGEDLEAKKEEIDKRRSIRNNNMLLAEQLKAKGDFEAAAKIQRNVVVRSAYTQNRIKMWCRHNEIRFVQAPYEADSEIAYLVKSGRCDFALTIDSDLIIYGCHKVLFDSWVNDDDDMGFLFDQLAIENLWGADFDVQCLLAVSILIGSDYWPGGLKKFGMARAKLVYRLLKANYSFERLKEVLEDIPGVSADSDFDTKFLMAWHTFHHQLIWDVKTNKAAPLLPYAPGKGTKDYPYAGNPSKAVGQLFWPKREQPLIKLPIINASRYRVHCKDCDGIFDNFASLQFHRLDHIRPILDCVMCGKHFGNMSALMRHIISHLNETPYECKICGDGFSLAINLKHHQVVHKDERPYACTICNRAFKHSNNLTKHMYYHTEERPFTCKECGMGFKIERHLARHEKVHNDEKEFECDICGMRFKEKRNLTTHQEVHVRTKLYPCEFCKRDFTLPRNLSRHLGTAHPGGIYAKCPICKTGCKTLNELKTHNRTIHNNKLKFCVHCGGAFACLRKHKKVCWKKPGAA